jgi:hypothetical protein
MDKVTYVDLSPSYDTMRLTLEKKFGKKSMFSKKSTSLLEFLHVVIDIVIEFGYPFDMLLS